MDELIAPTPLQSGGNSSEGDPLREYFAGLPVHGGQFFPATAEKYRNSQVLFPQSSTHTCGNSKASGTKGTEGRRTFIAGHLTKPFADNNPSSPHQFACDERVSNGFFWHSFVQREGHTEILQFDPCHDLINISAIALFQIINIKYISNNIYCKPTDYLKYGCRNITIHRAICGKFRKIYVPKAIPAWRDPGFRSRASQSHALIAFQENITPPIFTYSTAFQHNFHFNFFHGDCPWGHFLQGEPSWDHSTAYN